MLSYFSKYGLWSIVVYNSNLVNKEFFYIKITEKEKTEKENKNADTW